jgi:hypothetical protein
MRTYQSSHVGSMIPIEQPKMQEEAITDDELVEMADWYAELDYGFRDYESHAIDKAIH